MVLILAVICLKLSWINGFLQLILGLVINVYFTCIGERGIHYCSLHWSRAVAFSFYKRICRNSLRMNCPDNTLFVLL